MTTLEQYAIDFVKKLQTIVEKSTAPTLEDFGTALSAQLGMIKGAIIHAESLGIITAKQFASLMEAAEIPFLGMPSSKDTPRGN